MSEVYSGTADHAVSSQCRIDRVDNGRIEDTGQMSFEKNYLLRSINEVTVDEEIVNGWVGEWISQFKLRWLTFWKNAEKTFIARLNRISVNVEPDTENTIWRIVLEWATSQAGDTWDASLPDYPSDILPMSFSSEGGTVHVKQAFTELAYPLNEPHTNFMGQIGWNGTEFEGCDVIRPTFTFNLEKRFLYARNGVILPGKELLFDKWAQLTGCVNDRPFFGFKTGEVLFQGVSGQSEIERPSVTEELGYPCFDTEVYLNASFKFAVSFTRTMNVGGVVVNKSGWQYVWALNEMVDDPNTGRTYKQTVAAYVNTVYPGEFLGMLFDD